MTHPIQGLRRALNTEHEYLEGLFGRLLDCVHANDRETLLALWSVFERVLLDHLEWEEEHVLPEFAREHAGDAAKIRADHDRFRKLVAEIGMAVDLHLVREDMVREMVDLLRSHAKLEDEEFHRWAEERVSGSVRDELIARVHARIDPNERAHVGAP